MRRNIVVCCDGTANEFASNHTNVLKLYRTLVHDPAVQATHYHPGIGTMEPAGALTTITRKTTKLLGMAIGYGLADDIRDAYVFLMQHARPDDRLFLFGFSRGAYTVKAVASLLCTYGLIRPGNEALVPYAIRMLQGIERVNRDRADQEKARKEYFALADQFKRDMARECKPHFVGLWDTVSSVGWIENPLKLPFVASNPDIAIGRHAVAIDERRAFFRTHLWRPSSDPATAGPVNLKQVWFPGVHSDVGGGYPEEESGLSKIALEWMLGEAIAEGLIVDVDRKREVLGAGAVPHMARPDPNAMMHESLKGAWHLAEFVWKKHFNFKTGRVGRRMNLYRRRTIPPGAHVHEAAFARGGGYADRLPKNVVRETTRP
jgi:uncharacterized protein (DUF2235 family)